MTDEVTDLASGCSRGLKAAAGSADLFIEGVEGELCSVVGAADGGHIAAHHAGVGLTIILAVPLPVLLYHLQQHSQLPCLTMCLAQHSQLPSLMHTDGPCFKAMSQHSQHGPLMRLFQHTQLPSLVRISQHWQHAFLICLSQHLQHVRLVRLSQHSACDFSIPSPACSVCSTW